MDSSSGDGAGTGGTASDTMHYPKVVLVTGACRFLGGYLTALQRFGTKSAAEVFASAIDYAQNGYPIDASLAARSADTVILRLALVKDRKDLPYSENDAPEVDRFLKEITLSGPHYGLSCKSR